MTDDSTPGTDGSSTYARAVSHSSATVSPVIGDLLPVIVTVLLMIDDLLPMIATVSSMIDDLLPVIAELLAMIGDLPPMIGAVSRYGGAKRANTPENVAFCG